MPRILFAFLATALFVAFSIANTQHVELSFVFGSPVEIRLIFLLLIAFGSGVAASTFRRMLHEARERSQTRRIRLRLERRNLERRDAE